MGDFKKEIPLNKINKAIKDAFKEITDEKFTEEGMLNLQTKILEYLTKFVDEKLNGTEHRSIIEVIISDPNNPPSMNPFYQAVSCWDQETDYSVSITAYNDKRIYCVFAICYVIK